MPKQIFCAKCGQELHFLIKALPRQQITVTVVEPHKCLKETKKNPFKDTNNELILKPKEATNDLDKLFDSFEFNKEIGGKGSVPNPFDTVGGDKRSKDLLFDPLANDGKEKTAAPKGILKNINSSPNSSPEHELKE